MSRLVGDDQNRSPGNIAYHYRAADILDQLGDPEEGTNYKENPDQKNEHGKVKDVILSRKGGEAGEQHKCRCVGWPENSVPGTGKDWSNDGSNGAGDDAILNRKVGDDRISHALGKGEQRNVEAGGGIGAQRRRIIASESSPNRKRVN